MNSKIITTVVLIPFFMAVNAQLKIDNPNSSVAQSVKAVPGRLLVTFANAIRTESYLPNKSKQRKSVLTSAAKISDLTIFVKNISYLAGFIKTNKFKAGVATATILKSAGSSTTFGHACNLLRELEAGLKAEAFSPIWNLSRAAWLKDIDQLSRSGK